jgi:glycerol-3-phosphate acyltransferase PlsX
MSQLTIALDAMGGDAGADMAIEGTAMAAKATPDVNFLVFGDQGVLEPLIASHRGLSDRVEVRHTDLKIEAEDKPSNAVRRGQKSSMGLAIGSVRDGEAQVAVSAGNTGALMALSKVLLRTLSGIDRPALATLIPTRSSDTVMLDLGANVEGNVENLVQFAVMGAAFARTVLGLERPTVGLLNVGVEELKGHDTVKATGRLLRGTTLPMEFSGFIEGDGISAGVIDVLVTDGFTGNIAIKTAEGTAKLISAMLVEAFQSGILSRLGYFLASPGLNTLRNHLDPNSHNGAVFLGLNGLVVKSHGGANSKGFATAIGVAARMARADLCRLISDDLKNFGHHDQLEKKVVEVE